MRREQLSRLRISRRQRHAERRHEQRQQLDHKPKEQRPGDAVAACAASILCAGIQRVYRLPSARAAVVDADCFADAFAVASTLGMRIMS